MVTKIGYKIKGDNDNGSMNPALILFSKSQTVDAEAIFRKLAKDSKCTTDLFMKIAEYNKNHSLEEHGCIFQVDAFWTACYKNSVNKILSVMWDYTDTESPAIITEVTF